jgi:tRNA/tmRNA/rRNA uracil-C5-methylase (TrmA/RlmC/RlmD family)
METLRVRIDDVAFGGDGVGRHDGKVVFVPFTIAGEEVTARVLRAKKKFLQAALVAVESASPHRVEPRCPYFGRCGGCAYQHIAYSEQLAIKTRQVEQTLRRVGKLANPPVSPAVGSPLEYEYRNRIRVHAAGGLLGFFATDGQTLIDIECCPISSARVNDELRLLRSKALRDGDYTAAERDGVYFRQTNDGVAAILLEHVASLITPGQALLIDAYCGAGFFAKGLAAKFEAVIGIEENAFAIEYAAQTANPHERYLAGDVALRLDDALNAAPAAETTLLLDPPATGISPRVSDIVLSRQPREIIYVSCDPATLARDLSILCRTYTLQRVTPFDMFPQTAEIEVAAHLALP